MHRTERKTDQKKQPERERQQEQRKQSSEAASEWALTLNAILAGGSKEQLPAERIRGLSGVMGNSALAELFATRNEGPRFAERDLPQGECMTAPAAFDVGGEPSLVSPPDGLSAAPPGNAQPMTV